VHEPNAPSHLISTHPVTLDVFGWAPNQAFGLARPGLACLVARPALGARLYLACRTTGARPKKKHGTGDSFGARLRLAPRARVVVGPLGLRWPPNKRQSVTA
jgi:hypothetical protein